MGVMTRCLDCGARTTRGSRCQRCARARHNEAYPTARRPFARAVIAASPRCARCGSTDDLTVDHIVPVIYGRGRGPVRVLCRSATVVAAPPSDLCARV